MENSAEETDSRAVLTASYVYWFGGNEVRHHGDVIKAVKSSCGILVGAWPALQSCGALGLLRLLALRSSFLHGNRNARTYRLEFVDTRSDSDLDSLNSCLAVANQKMTSSNSDCDLVASAISHLLGKRDLHG
jgi:hypothetical protein